MEPAKEWDLKNLLIYQNIYNMKIFKKNTFVSIEFSDGNIYTNSDCNEDVWNYIREHQQDEEAVQKYIDNLSGTTKIKASEVNNSKILKVRGNTVYMPSVSELSIPQDFVTKILEAEENNDVAEINKYKNFWTLVSLNPDSRVRDNIFWFIRKWDMKLTESGFIIAYRNADIYKESEFTQEEIKDIITSYYTEKYYNNNDPKSIIFRDDESLEEVYQGVVGGKYAPVFTDQHSHSTRIVLGKPVSIPREDCDAEQENSCSKGLHTGAKGWLKSNYYGQVGMQVLVNPAKIVAVPTIDQYGKMRTCEYFPVALIDFDSNGDVIESPISLYNDIEYLKHIKYDGEINNQEAVTYEILKMHQSVEEMYDDILRRLHETN